MSAEWKCCVEAPAPKPTLLAPMTCGACLACSSMGMPMLPIRSCSLQDRQLSRAAALQVSHTSKRAGAFRVRVSITTLHARCVMLHVMVLHYVVTVAGESMAHCCRRMEY